MRKNKKRQEQTPSEQRAIQLFAEIARVPETDLRVVRAVEVGVWYDWVDPVTEKCGQCRMREDWTWLQSPLGQRPVVIELVPRENKQGTRRER